MYVGQQKQLATHISVSRIILCNGIYISMLSMCWCIGVVLVVSNVAASMARWRDVIAGARRRRRVSDGVVDGAGVAACMAAVWSG